MNPKEEGGSRIGIILNGSPLFTGGAGSGESEIRRYILENDLQIEKWRKSNIVTDEDLHGSLS